MKIKLYVSKLALLFLAVLLAGCSVSYLYRQLDWLVPSYISDYITLDEQQQGELERRLMVQLNWHCSTQLPRYAAWLRRVHDTPDAFSRKGIDHNYETTRRFWHDLMLKVTPDAAGILSDATDKQVNELTNNLKRKQESAEKRLAKLSASERVQQRSDRMQRILQRWLGGLEPSQAMRIKKWSEKLQGPQDGSSKKSHHRWQQRFIAALSKRKDKAQFTRLLRRLLAEPESFWSDSYRREYEHRRELTLNMLADVAATMTPAQRSHLQDEILSWADELQSLACKPDKVNLKTPEKKQTMLH